MGLTRSFSDKATAVAGLTAEGEAGREHATRGQRRPGRLKAFLGFPEAAKRSVGRAPAQRLLFQR